MIRHVKRAVVVILILFFFAIGIAGVILPIVPGLIFIAVALILLSLLLPSLREYLLSYTHKYPKLHATVLKVEEFVKRIVGEL